MEGEVEVYIVEGVQEFPMLIGQSFLNTSAKVLMVNGDEIRLFKAEALPPTKVSLSSEKDVLVPTNHIGYVKIYT